LDKKVHNHRDEKNVKQKRETHQSQQPKKGGEAQDTGRTYHHHHTQSINKA
jgi:hypothetical protein